MAKVYLICGKICSGKTTYAEKLKERENAVILSSDELMLSLFDPLLGEKHDEISRRANDYLMELAVKIVEAGTSVILDWGFWTRSGRREASAFFERKGMACQWHYVSVSGEQWKRNIEKRNREVEAGETQAYFVDEGLLVKLEKRFEEPQAGEIDVYAENGDSIQNMR